MRKHTLIMAMMAAFAVFAFSSAVSAEPDKDKNGCYEPRSMAEAESLLSKDCKPHLPKPEISGEVSYDCGNWYLEVEYIETWFGQESRVDIDAPGSANDSSTLIGTDGQNDSGLVATLSGELPTEAFQVEVELYYDKPFDGQGYVFIGDITEDVEETDNTCPTPEPTPTEEPEPTPTPQPPVIIEREVVIVPSSPVIVEREVVVEVERVTEVQGTRTISPPSTGEGGLK